MNFLTNLNLNRNEIQNAVIQPLAVAPSNPKEGQIYYNNSDKFIYRYNGTAWGPIGVVYQQGSTTGAVITGLDNAGNVTTTNVVGLTLTGYSPVSGGYVSNNMTLQQALAALDTAVKNAVSSGGEVNQNAWSNIIVPVQSTNTTTEVAEESSDATIAADAKIDTLTIASGDAWTKIDADAANKKITLGHKISGVGTGSYGSASKIPKITTDNAGHITGIQNVTIPGVQYISKLTSDAQTQLNNILGSSSDTSGKATVYGARALASSALSTANDALSEAQDALQEANNRVQVINPKDNAIFIGGATVAPTIGLNISSATGNLAQIVSDGLKVVAPEYSIAKDATAQDGFIATYHLTKDGSNIGEAINIPKDYLVKSAEVKVATGSDASGFDSGVTYIDFVVNTYDTTSGSGTESHIYLNVETLVKTHTAGNGISISDTNVVSAKVVAANGLSVDSNGIKMAVASETSNGAMTSAMVQKLNSIDFHKYTATNGVLSASGGAFTWTINASTHGISNVGIIVQLYEVSTGAMVLADVTVNPSTYAVTISINDIESVGTLASNTYRVVIFG